MMLNVKYSKSLLSIKPSLGLGENASTGNPLSPLMSDKKHDNFENLAIANDFFNINISDS